MGLNIPFICLQVGSVSSFEQVNQVNNTDSIYLKLQNNSIPTSVVGNSPRQVNKVIKTLKIMEKRFQIIDDKSMECTILIVLTQSEQMLLESKDLLPQIENIAKDLHIRWAIESSDNVVQLAVSKLLGPVGTSKDAHELEITATNFMSAVNKLTLPAFDEAKQENHEEWKGNSPEDELKFVKELKKDINDIACSMLMPMGVPSSFAVIAANIGHIGHYCLERMIDAYLEKYDK